MRLIAWGVNAMPVDRAEFEKQVVQQIEGFKKIRELRAVLEEADLLLRSDAGPAHRAERWARSLLRVSESPDFEFVPPLVVEQAISAGSDLLAALTSVSSFYHGSPRGQTWDKVIGNAGVKESDFATAVSTIGNFTITVATLAAVLDRTDQVASSASLQVQHASTLCEMAVSDVRRSVSLEAAELHAEWFKGASETAARRAWWWLGATIFMAAVGATSIAIFASADHGDTTAEAIRFLSSKVLFAGLVSFALVFCARNYAAEKHNETVNRHREHALKTYRSLMRGPDDQGTLNVVMGYAAACIFSPQPTGFSKEHRSADGGGPSENLLKIVASSVSSSGKADGG